MKRVGILIALTFSLSLKAETQQAPQDLLIEKLSHVNLNLPSQDPSKVAVMLRLADLLAERARLASMKDLESGCTVCEAGKVDRQKALRLYEDGLSKSSPDQKGKILIQMGHLYQLLGNEKLSIAHYQRVFAEKPTAAMEAEANLSMAEIQFKKNHFAEARSFYQKVLDSKSASSRGLAAYRVAWCEFNLGHFREAVAGIKLILTTPELQNRSGGVATAQADRSFLEEVSRDLATFMSRTALSMNEVEEVYKLSPSTTRLANVILLANEYERTGKKAEAIETWNYAYERMSAPAMKLEALVHMTPLKFVENKTDEALKSLDASLALWSELNGCGAKDCAEPQKILRGFIVNWNQTEKKSPSENLLKAYQGFCRTFPEDLQMTLWAAQVAQARQDWAAASSFYKAAAVGQKKSAKTQDLETTLLAYLEMSEISKNADIWNEAAALYLSESPKQTKAYEVRYQKAKRSYDKGENELSAGALREIALDQKAPLALRTQAAHLSLDAVGILKDEARLQAWSREYSTVLKSSAKDFSQISQKTVLSKTAHLAETNLEGAWQELNQFNSAEASAADKKIYLKNKIVLAEKTKRLSAASQAVEEYLLLPDLTKEERDYGMSRKAWFAELRLDFSTALKTLEKINTTELKPDQKMLKLALYADLAGINSQSYYQNFMAATKEVDLKADIAAELVRKSENPLAELSKQSALLRSKPEVLARLYAEVYQKTPTEKVLKAAQSEKAIEGTNWGRAFWRIGYLDQIQNLKKKLAASKVDSTSQKSMGKTIKSRNVDLEAAEKLTAQAIQKADWTAQVVSMTLLSKESQRFYEELMSLPLPSGLSPEEESQYMSLLGQQAAPFKNKADEAKSKLAEFWAGSWKEPLQKSVSEAKEFHSIVVMEVKAIHEVAEAGNQAFLAPLMQTREPVARPTLQNVEVARNDVRESPFDSGRLGKLLDLEKQNKNFAMVQYLEGRIKQLNADPQAK